MIRSMTGFGRASGQVLEREVSIELRSVNNRFRDVVMRAPKTYAGIEDNVKKIVAEYVDRGRVEMYVQVDESTVRQQNLTLDLELARIYYDLLGRLKDELDLKEELTISHLLEFRDIIRHESEELDLEEFMSGLDGILREALERLGKMRVKEGAAIASDFVERLEAMKKWVEEIHDLRESVEDGVRNRLETRIKSLGDAIELDPSRLLQEVGYILERGDITEEIVRLRSHFDQFGELVRKGGTVGRRLEFLLQEINREVNTIGSKSSDVRITNKVVDLKTELEKLREQVLNVE